MPAWYSPFPFDPSQEEALRLRGWQRWSGNPAQLPADSVVLYATPDQLLASSTLDLEQLLDGYRQLLALEPAPRLVSVWRLLAELPLPEPPAPDPLAAVITLWGLERTPPLLDAYLDLELRADLLGGEPDLAYGQRLQNSLCPETLLLALRASSAGQQLNQAVQEEFQLALSQLHQVQDELEYYYYLSQAQKQLLAGHRQLSIELLDQLAALVSPCAVLPSSA